MSDIARRLTDKFSRKSPNHPGPKLTPEQREAVVIEYATTVLTITELARKYGISPQSVRSLIATRVRRYAEEVK